MAVIFYIFLSFGGENGQFLVMDNFIYLVIFESTTSGPITS